MYGYHLYSNVLTPPCPTPRFSDLCLRLDREIAPIDPKTAEGHQAPLRRVDVTRPWASDIAGIGGDIYTPTFIVVENGTEVARLRGYPGEHFFWPLLNEMLQRLPHLQPDSGPAADS